MKDAYVYQGDDEMSDRFYLLFSSHKGPLLYFEDGTLQMDHSLYCIVKEKQTEQEQRNSTGPIQPPTEIHG